MRCAACGTTWRAEPETPPEAAPIAAAAPEEDDLIAVPLAGVEDASPERPAAVPEIEAARRPTPIRDQIEQRKRDARLQGLAWTALGAVVALLLAGGVVFRINIVQLWPSAAGVYARIGLPVNGIGLGIEKVHGQQSLLDGRPALVVTGVVHNIRKQTLVSPPLTIALLDRAGRQVAVRTVLPDDRIVPPGQTRDFSTAFLNPPSGASGLDITFAASTPPRPGH